MLYSFDESVGDIHLMSPNSFKKHYYIYSNDTVNYKNHTYDAGTFDDRDKLNPFPFKNYNATHKWKWADTGEPMPLSRKA